MKLPSFTEFEKTITPEQRENWFDAGSVIVSENPTIDELVTIAVRSGYLSARGMLESYHVWLTDQLANRK